ncbi:PKD domain-containing protein [Neolewinella litorea]|uniref:T9SS type A sorting domain-containing protein n=1 Tax=Neolewinella litorea TaxID=2562452 RepID=A0A4S4NEL3_9BACT|nr:PKD domain-containing protein [Neolewinella litorea]THH36551.1 T9SS type A sorting domain-containing protein [Neolewinella litorea]
MKFTLALKGAIATAFPKPSFLAFLLLLLATSALWAVPPAFAGPTAKPIPAQNVMAETPRTFVVNGSFTGQDLTYSASQADGRDLPDWMSFSPSTGTFKMLAPAAAVGELFHFRVTARGADGLTASSTFYLMVGDNWPDCRIDASTDRLGKIIHCAGDTVTLRGASHNDQYRWTGPSGFASTEQEPRVTVPGLYVLSTGDAACPNRAIVEVMNLNDCAEDPDNNNIPVALIRADRLTGGSPLTINFDATTSNDVDGDVLQYVWLWEGGSATGPKPSITFPQGSHEVILLVTDDTGARSTDRVYVNGFPPPTYASFWLEAECARIGDNWVAEDSDNAAGGTYVKALRTSTSSAPADSPENHIRFVVRDAREGAFRLFARVDAPDGFSDSYYVRVNEGPWYAWKSGLVRGMGFQWNEMLQQLNLVGGTNTIDIAYRESNTRIDKLFLTATTDRPGGLGGTDYSCTAPNEPPVAVASVNRTVGTAPLAVTFDGTASSDLDGKIVSYDWTWAGGSARGIQPTVTLSAGSYAVTLTVTDDGGLQDSDVVNVQVDAAQAPPADGDYWLEAECAAVGNRWTTSSSSNASGGKYVVAQSDNSMSVAPADLDENRVRFTVSAASAGTFKLFARINAPSNTQDSYWVRLNGGEWYKWNSRIIQSSGFQWNQLPITLALKAGGNTIDFAFREPGTQLDKLYLTGKGSLPTGFGAAADNCGESSPAGAIEAECALLSTGWSQQYSSGAAGGSYMVFMGDRHLDEPAATDVGQELRYEVVTTEAGPYHLFMRVDAPDPSRNSVWVKVDNQPWMKFWRETTGDQLLTTGFEWRKVNHDGTARSIELGVGYHTIRVANREPGTKVDKLMLTTADAAPSGYGPEAANCGSTTSQALNSTMSSLSATPTGVSTTGLAGAPIVDVFPNPAVDQLTLELNSDYTGTVDLIVYDLHGRRVQEQVLEKDSDHLTANLTIGSLPSGMYQVRVIEGDRSTTESFIRR